MDRQEAQDRQDIRDRQRRDKRKAQDLIDNWQLHVVDDIEYRPDYSGIYVLINWDVLTESVRLDVMTEKTNMPLVAFRGRADNVRKAVMSWLEEANVKAILGTGDKRIGLVSLEHAAYIGAELERADAERIDYVQS